MTLLSQNFDHIFLFITFFLFWFIKRNIIILPFLILFTSLFNVSFFLAIKCIVVNTLFLIPLFIDLWITLNCQETQDTMHTKYLTSYMVDSELPMWAAIPTMMDKIAQTIIQINKSWAVFIVSFRFVIFSLTVVSWASNSSHLHLVIPAPAMANTRQASDNN